MDSVILSGLIVKWFMPIFAFKIFENAGYKWWHTLIPIYNYYVWIKIVGKPWWWLIIAAIPFIGYFIMFLLLVETAKAHDKHSLWQEALATIVPFVYLPYLGYKATYYPPDKRPEFKKSSLREWVDAIIFAVVGVGILRMFMFEAYTIPSSSMEKTLLVGDYLFVNKMTYGSRRPMTPLSVPFIHNTLPLSKRNSYCDKVQLKYYRYPALKKLKNYSPIVFNYPEGDTVCTAFQSNASYYSLVRNYGRRNVITRKDMFGDIIYRPVDKRENYIKRCIAIPGDTMQVIDGYAYINGVKENHKGKLQFTYTVKTNGSQFRPAILKDELKITEKYTFNAADSTYNLTLTDEAVEILKKNSSVISITKNIQRKEDYFAENCKMYLFPYDTAYQWTVDNYGPLYIPRKGDTLHLTLKNICLYERLIDVYEDNDIEVRNGKIYINNEQTDTYVTKMDYYWMMGDNRHNSADSRFWGFVPEDHIVGKPAFVWMSLDKEKGLFNGKIRWNKMFRTIH